MYIEESVFNKLNAVIKTMDLPDWRKQKNTIENVRWLYDNMGKRNSKHQNYDKARNFINSLLEGKNK